MDLENLLRAKIKSIPISKVLILGVGNTLKADDGIGPAVCEALKPKFAGQVIDGGTAPENYLQKIIDFSPRLLLIIDAMDFGGREGEIRLIKPDELGGYASSTHGLNPRVFSDLIAGQCNTEILFLGIQPRDLTMGRPMTAEMKHSMQECIHWFTVTLLL